MPDWKTGDKESEIMLKVGNTVIRKTDAQRDPSKPRQYEIIAKKFIDWVMDSDGDGMYPVYSYTLKDAKTGVKVPGTFAADELRRI